MIQELYLKRAVTIRKDYLKIVTDIDKYENIAKDLSSSLVDRMEDLKDLLSKLNEGKVSNPEHAKQELHNIVLHTEDDINKVDISIEDLNKKIDKLRQDEVALYREMKQNYFNLSDDEIKNEIQEHLIKLSLS